MATSVAPEPRFVAAIRSESLVPGYKFEYKVPAEKGHYGDFPGKYPFEVHGSWLIRAVIMCEAEVKRKELYGAMPGDARAEEAIAGHRALFEVFPGVDEIHESLMSVDAVVLPRSAESNKSGRVATYPVEHGFSTIFARVLLDTKKPEDGLRYVIPARNIQPGTLRILGVPPPEGTEC